MNITLRDALKRDALPVFDQQENGLKEAARFSDFAKPCIVSDNRHANDIYMWMQSDTSPEEFDRKCGENPGYDLTVGGSWGFSSLHEAVRVGNIPLIDHIARKNPSLLIQADQLGILTPLHFTAFIPDSVHPVEVAKRLIQLGTPVNIIGHPTRWDKKIHGIKINDTTLGIALREKKFNLAGYLLRAGGISRHNDKDNLNEAKKKIFTTNEKYFFQHAKGKLPTELILLILDLSARV